MVVERTFYFRQNINNINDNDSKALYLLFKIAERLYNEALYYVRNEFKKDGSYKGWIAVDEYLKDSINYKLLGDRVAKSIIRNLDVNYSNFFKSIKKNEFYNTPKFRNKYTSFFISFFGIRKTTKNTVCISLSNMFREKYGFEAGYILCFNVSKRFLLFNQDITQLRLHRNTKNNSYYIVYHYKKDVEQLDVVAGRAMGIDFGATNLMTIYTNIENEKPIIIKGGHVKYLNHQVFKRFSKDFKRGNKITDKMIDHMIYKNDKIDVFYNRIVRYLEKYVIAKKIEKIHVGAFIGIKNSEKFLNRTFQRIPYLRLRLKLRDRMNKIGVKVYFIDESYTSKTSFLDEEFPQRQNPGDYEGKRVKRGLFRTNDGKLINADVNGAAQILIKGKSFVKNRKNALLNPKILKN